MALSGVGIEAHSPGQASPGQPEARSPLFLTLVHFQYSLNASSAAIATMLHKAPCGSGEGLDVPTSGIRDKGINAECVRNFIVNKVVEIRDRDA